MLAPEREELSPAHSRIIDIQKVSYAPQVKTITDKLILLFPEACNGNAKVRKRIREHINMVILNAYLNWYDDPYLCTAYSRDNCNLKVKSRYNALRIYIPILRNVVDTLIAHQYLYNFAGYKYPDTGVGYCSKFCATLKFIELFNVKVILVKEVITDQNAECIILKGSDGKRIEYEDSDFTNSCRERLHQHNQLLFKTEIRVGDKLLPPQFVQRIFNKTFDRGGRFYCAAWHIMPSEDRSKILINSDATVELDYKGIHPNMLYNQCGIVKTDGIYTIPGLDVDRSIVKLIFNTLVNCKDLTQAKRVIQSEINLGNIMLPKIYSVDGVIEKILEFHRGIAELIFSKSGVKLQFLDSEITSEIMQCFTDSNIPVLTIHDSYIVTEQHEGLLRHAMIDSYRRRFNATPIITRKT